MSTSWVTSRFEFEFDHHHLLGVEPKHAGDSTISSQSLRMATRMKAVWWPAMGGSGVPRVDTGPLLTIDRRGRCFLPPRTEQAAGRLVVPRNLTGCPSALYPLYRRRCVHKSLSKPHQDDRAHTASFVPSVDPSGPNHHGRHRGGRHRPVGACVCASTAGFANAGPNVDSNDWGFEGEQSFLVQHGSQTVADQLLTRVLMDRSRALPPVSTRDLPTTERLPRHRRGRSRRVV